MDLEKLKRQIGTNIALQRKNAGLTQAGLAEKLNYSDKAVSKWERGDSTPDILTLVQLSELFEVSVSDLLSLCQSFFQQGKQINLLIEGVIAVDCGSLSVDRLLFQPGHQYLTAPQNLRFRHGLFLLPNPPAQLLLSHLPAAPFSEPGTAGTTG